MSNYGDPKYWEQRYVNQEGERFDWLEDYQALKQYLQKYMISGKNTKILNIGCGNGQIQDGLYKDGYENIVNNDISETLIKHMNESNKHEKMVFEVMDVTEMTYKDQSFELVIDKSTIDALLCSSTPLVSVAKMMKHIHRILVDNGYYFVVSYGDPPTRMIHFSRKHISFDIKVIQIEGRNGTPHYIYCCKKNKFKIQEQQYANLLEQLADEEIKLMEQGLDLQESGEEQSGQYFNQSQINSLFGV